MESSLQDYDDMFAGLSPEILKNIFIRFYTIEDYFEFTPEECEDETEMKPEVPLNTKAQSATMYYNRLIQGCVCDLYIMNKLINTKAKLVNGLLENGRNIAKKKNSSWNEFIQEKGFGDVRQAYGLLSPVRKNIVKFLVLSISNLLLKLSINMSKVSVIPLQKFLSFEALNIPTLSIIFLQYIQFKLFRSKNMQEDQAKINFMRQLPKITFIKLNYNKNHKDMELLSKSQDLFINKQVNQSIKNMQYIEIHENTLDPIFPKCHCATENEAIPYEYFHSIDLEKITGGATKSPFTFEILEVMRQIVLPMVKDFKPDLIVYMESYPNGMKVMDDEVRGLMICEMAEETGCNKMYVFKEMGEDKREIFKYRELCKEGEEGEKINEAFYKVFDDCEAEIVKKNDNFKKIKQLGEKDTPESIINTKKIQNWRKIFMNELCYTSLALIQKTSFENILEASHKHYFNTEFLAGICKEQESIMEKNKNSKTQENLINYLKVKNQGTKMMLEVHKYRLESNDKNGFKIINLVNKENKFKSFYNLQEKEEQRLIVRVGEVEEQWEFEEEDHFIVKYYGEERLLVFIIKNRFEKVEFKICSKNKGEKTLKFEAEIKTDPYCDYIEGATYICSNEYIFRGFGKFKFPVQNGTNEPIEYNQSIHRLQIFPEIGKEWEKVNDISLKPVDSKDQKCALEKKMYGYGIFNSENNAVLFMGGYIDSYDEEKISKNIYVIKKADSSKDCPSEKVINVIGKTNKIVFNTNENIKNMFLNPFVFGIPFYFANSQNSSAAYVLNSNGYYLNLNHSNKIFTTHIKLSSILQYNGINMQNKLKISQDIDSASLSIFLSEVLIKCMVKYPYQINTRGECCCIQTIDEGVIEMRAISEKNSKKLEVRAREIFEDDEWKTLEFISFYQ